MAGDPRPRRLSHPILAGLPAPALGSGTGLGKWAISAAASGGERGGAAGCGGPTHNLSAAHLGGLSAQSCQQRLSSRMGGCCTRGCEAGSKAGDLPPADCSQTARGDQLCSGIDELGARAGGARGLGGAACFPLRASCPAPHLERAILPCYCLERPGASDRAGLIGLCALHRHPWHDQTLPRPAQRRRRPMNSHRIRAAGALLLHPSHPLVEYCCCALMQGPPRCSFKEFPVVRPMLHGSSNLRYMRFPPRGAGRVGPLPRQDCRSVSCLCPLGPHHRHPQLPLPDGGPHGVLGAAACGRPVGASEGAGKGAGSWAAPSRTARLPQAQQLPHPGVRVTPAAHHTPPPRIPAVYTLRTGEAPFSARSRYACASMRAMLSNTPCRNWASSAGRGSSRGCSCGSLTAGQRVGGRATAG